MIIGVSGKIGSGKDEIGNIIHYLTGPKNKEEYDSNINYSFFSEAWKTKKWADKLKNIVCILLGCTREQLEDREFKEGQLSEEWDKWLLQVEVGDTDDAIYFSTEDEAKNYLEKNYSPYPNFSHQGNYEGKTTHWGYTITKEIMTPRLILQLLGTNCGRDIIHPNLWINSLMSEYDEERWVPVNLYEENYEVSSYGKIRNLKTGKILKPTKSGNYYTVSLNGKTFTVHFLIASHFCGKQEIGRVVNHKDFDTSNNYYKNLEWITQTENIAHNKKFLKHAHGERQADSKLTDDDVVLIKKLLKLGEEKQYKIAELFEVSTTTISDIKLGKKWSHVGKIVANIETFRPPNWVVTDTRFPNEAWAILNKKGLVIRVTRGNGSTGNHPSETALDDFQDWSEIIYNNGTIKDLVEDVRKILIKRGILKK